MTLNLNEILSENNITLAVIPPEKFVDKRLEILKQLDKNFNRIAYVSLNKIILPLRRELSNNDIDTNKLYFIDAVTKTAIPSPPKITNCIYVTSPNDLTKISISITKVMHNFDPDCFFFDSLSTLLIYENVTITSQFIHSFVNKINAFGTKCVLTCLEGEKEKQLIRNLSLLIDKVISDI